MNSIATDQVAEIQLARLAAQRQLYADAKAIHRWEAVAGVPLTLAIGAAALWAPWARELAVVCSVLLMVLGMPLSAHLQRRLRGRAARIQELFDCDVLQMEWNEVKCGRRPGAEFVAQHEARFRAGGGDMSRLRDWYPPEVAPLSLHQARILCQRTNCWWDGNQRRRYAWLGLGGTSAAVALLVAGGLATGIGAANLALAAVPLAVSWAFGVRHFIEHQVAARRVDRLREHAEALWSRASDGTLGAPHASRASRALQDEIFEHRRQNPSTVDWVYDRLRTEYEVLMNKGADVLIAAAEQTAPAPLAAAAVEPTSPVPEPTSPAQLSPRASTSTLTPARGEPGVLDAPHVPAAPSPGEDGHAAVEPATAAQARPSFTTRRRLTILSVATEWASGRGGLSTFNREFCLAAARVGHRVLCFVPSASAEESMAAAAAGVSLVAAHAAPGITDEMRLLQRPELGPGVIPDVVVGHGRVTGPAAKVLAEQHFAGARRIHLFHMAPDAIEWFKDRAPGQSSTETAETRTRIEIDLATTAQLAAAVGPLLARDFGTLLHGRDVVVQEFLPGLLSEPLARGPAPAAQCLVLGRAEDAILKGLDIAARAVARVAARRPEVQPRLLIRGAPPGTGDALRRQMLEFAGVPGLDVVVRAYTSEADRIVDDIRQSSVVLMPSRSEGFGLVGLEALSIGVPVLVSAHSGLARALARDSGELARAHVVPVTRDLDVDGEEWARQIEFVLTDRAAAFARAHSLQAALRDKWSWAVAVERLLGALEGDGPLRRAAG